MSDPTGLERARDIVADVVKSLGGEARVGATLALNAIDEAMAHIDARPALPPLPKRPPHDAQSPLDAIRRLQAWLDSPCDKGGVWLDWVPDSFMDAWGNADVFLDDSHGPTKDGHARAEGRSDG